MFFKNYALKFVKLFLNLIDTLTFIMRSIFNLQEAWVMCACLVFLSLKMEADIWPLKIIQSGSFLLRNLPRRSFIIYRVTIFNTTLFLLFNVYNSWVLTRHGLQSLSRAGEGYSSSGISRTPAIDAILYYTGFIKFLHFLLSHKAF